ncbi:MAG: hypothetical protein M3Q10_06720 [Chloroflexota bacterium]|nr:hypothetical protein [Chloroflexota bacterium]
MEKQSTATRAAAGGAFGAVLALITGSTPIGVAIVAALGAGLAIKAAGGRARRHEAGSIHEGTDKPGRP